MSTHLRRTVRAATALAATVAIFGAGAAPAAAQEPGTITIWADELMGQALGTAAANYSEQTGIPIDVQVKVYEGINDEFLAQVAAGQGPDLLINGQSPVGLFVANGAISPIELGDKADLFAPASIAAYTYDDKIYGLPYAVENIALLRNTDLAPTAPATFDEAIAMGQELVDAGQTELPFLLHTDGGDNGDAYHMYPLQTSMGNFGFGLNEAGGWDVSDVSTIDIDNEAGLAFAERIKELGDLGILNAELTSDVALEKFMAGDSPFFVTGPWFLPAIQESGMNYAIDPIPTLGDLEARPFVGVIGAYLNSKSENALAATDFLVNYLTTDEAAIQIYEDGGKPPALMSGFEAVSDDKDVQAWGQAGANGIPLPNDARAGAFWQNVGKIQQAILRGQGDPVELWQKLGDDMRATYEELDATAG